MKHIPAFIVFSLIVSFTILLASPLYAAFEDDYQSYLKTYDTYRDAHDRYLTTRNQYLAYGTLNSKNDAFLTLKDFLTSRNRVLLSYFYLLKQKNVNSNLEQTLADQQNYISSNQTDISSSGSLEDSLTLSAQVENQQIAFLLTSKKTVLHLLITRVSHFIERVEKLEQRIATMLQTLKTQGKNTDTPTGWLIYAGNKRDEARKKLEEAKTKTDNLAGTNEDGLTNDANEIQFMTFEATKKILEAISFLNELTQTLKYGNY